MPANLSHKRNVVAYETARNRFWPPIVENNLHRLAHRSFRKPRAGKVQNSLHFFRSHVKNIRDLLNGQASLQVVEHRLHRHTCSPEDPRAAQLAWNTFHRWTLRPIKIRHRSTSSSRVRLPQNPSTAASNFTPNHARRSASHRSYRPLRKHRLRQQHQTRHHQRHRSQPLQHSHRSLPHHLLLSLSRPKPNPLLSPLRPKPKPSCANHRPQRRNPKPAIPRMIVHHILRHNEAKASHIQKPNLRTHLPIRPAPSPL